MSSNTRPKGTEVRNLEVYQDAMILERVMCTCNSYLGMLKWCNSYRLRSQGVDFLNKSAWTKYIYFNREKLKATIRYKLRDKVTARSQVRICKSITEEIITKAA